MLNILICKMMLMGVSFSNNLSSSNHYNELYLQIVYSFAVIHLSSLLVHLYIIEMLVNKCYYYFHFKHEEAEAF